MSRIGWIRLLVIAIAVGALELACDTELIDHRILIAPSQMAVAMAQILIDPDNYDALGRTMLEVISAVVLAVIAGFLLGLLIHALPRLRRALDPFFATYYAVPIFIFYPAMVAIFGLSPIPVILIGFAAGTVAMLIATLNGLDRIPKVLTKVARVHRMSRAATAWKLTLPAAAPHLFTGVKLSVSYVFIAVVASEFILAPAGLGHEISYAYNDFDNNRMYGLMLLLLVLATVINMGLHGWDRRLAARRGRG